MGSLFEGCQRHRYKKIILNNFYSIVPTKLPSSVFASVSGFLADDINSNIISEIYRKNRLFDAIKQKA